MRAAPGAVPRAIAQLSRRIDIASNPSTAARVAKIHECRVNPGAIPSFNRSGLSGQERWPKPPRGHGSLTAWMRGCSVPARISMSAPPS